MENIHFVGDCLEVLDKEVHDESVNLIITSPPYADARKIQYGGIAVDQYVDWWMEREPQFRRVLCPDGSFILNIKEKVVSGQRSTYVMKLIFAMIDAGWRWTEEYIWCKPNAFPGKWRNRFRDSWERCLHFTREKDFYMDQDAVRVPVGDWSKSRLKTLGDGDKVRHESRTGSKMGRNVSNWVGRDTVYPANVLHIPEEGEWVFHPYSECEQAEPATSIHLPGECGFKGHPAVFPVRLPEFFIKLFTRPYDLVLDPFVGSGTTSVAAKRLGRRSIGIDLMSEYIALADQRLTKETVQ